MSYEKILQEISEKKISPVYTLSGEETFFIDKIISALQTYFEPWAETSVVSFLGKNANSKEILQQAQGFPLWSEKQLILIREAQEVKNLEVFNNYLEKPNQKTVLVLAFNGKLAKNLKITKLLQQKSIFFEANKIPDWKLSEWVQQKAKEYTFSFHGEALAVFIENLGNDLKKIENAFEKLSLALPKNSKITVEHIEYYIGIHRLYNVFEWQKALANKDIKKALEITQVFGIQEKDFPLPMLLGVLYNFFSKLLVFHYVKQWPEPEIIRLLKISPFQIKEFRAASTHHSAGQVVKHLSILREYDLKSKGVGNVSLGWDVLLTEMVLKFF